MGRKVTVVRPYADDIRKRMFDVLERAGLQLDARHVIPSGTPDQSVLTTLRGRVEHVLLVPFHAHRDSRGQWTNGLELLVALEREAPEVDGPVLMPVSVFGAAGLQLLLDSETASKGSRESLQRRILLIPEDQLDDPELADRIRKHLDAAASRRSAPAT